MTKELDRRELLKITGRSIIGSSAATIIISSLVETPSVQAQTNPNCRSGVNVLEAPREVTVVAEDVKTGERLGHVRLPDGHGSLRWTRASNAVKDGQPAYQAIVFTEQSPHNRLSTLAKCGNAADVRFTEVVRPAPRPQTTPAPILPGRFNKSEDFWYDPFSRILGNGLIASGLVGLGLILAATAGRIAAKLNREKAAERS